MSTSRSWRFTLLQFLAWPVLVFLLLPVFVSVPLSLTPNRYLSLPDREISFRHYAHLFTDPGWAASAAQSMVIALAATAIALASGTLCAIGLWRMSSRQAELVRSLLLAPIIVPPVVAALAFYRLWIDLGLYDTYAGLILAHAILGAPFVVICVSTSLASFDPRLEQAARSLGATPRQAVYHVVMPGILPGILAGAVFAFIASWDEIVVASFIARRDIFTLPRRMFDSMRESVDPTIAAAATVLVLFTLAGFALYALIASKPEAGNNGK
ncbi:MAG: ABC transporter permease [Parvibaculaceae bacterium]